jgi:lysophospholipase
MERDHMREEFWAAFDAFVPGSPDQRDLPDQQPVAVAAEPWDEEEVDAESAAEELERSGMDAAVAGGDDRAAARG